MIAITLLAVDLLIADMTCPSGRGPVDTRSPTSFSMSIDSVIPDQTGQLEKPMSFSRLAWLLFPLELDSSAIVRWERWISSGFLL